MTINTPPRTPAARRRELLAIAIPATLTLLAEPILGVVDTAIAGRIGTAELGALGLATSLLAAVTWIFNFLLFGTTSTVAQALGRNDRNAAGERLAHAALLAALLGIGAALLIYATAPLIVAAAGAVPALVGPTVGYIRVRAIGVPFMLLGYVGHGAFRGAGDTRYPLGVVFVANLVNLALNILLVFGLGWGLEGIAAATVAAEIIIALWLALTASRKLGLSVRGHGLPTRTQIARLATMSRDLFLRTAALAGSIALIAAAAARVGAETAAAHQVIWQVYLLLAFLLDGLAVASQSMVGRAIGEGDGTELRATVNEALRWGATVGAVLAALLLVGQSWIVSVFTSDSVVKALIASVWWLPSLMMPLHALVFVVDGILMGGEDYAFIRRWMVTGAIIGASIAQIAVSMGGGLLWLWIGYEVVMLFRGVPIVRRAMGDAWLS
ncbi:MAG: MATE family efflux transporter [Anaerolineales bacterium]|nr:MATE family efflux transporter [Anaerolineales bacterium]MCB9128554.1 MATE family efflux transporter [Ardenticatenales bacterium]